MLMQSSGLTQWYPEHILISALSNGVCLMNEAIKPKLCDLIVFAGQSNMAGRGIVTPEHPEKAPCVPEGHGYEYRAISAPGILCNATEPFGVNENSEDGINDGSKKTGSMVCSFINAYYEQTGVPVMGISTSKGGSALAEWQPGTAYHRDLLQRIADAEEYLRTENIAVRHRYFAWCQGETDGDIGTSVEEYKRVFRTLTCSITALGFEKLLLIGIGRCNIPGSFDRYDEVIRWQHELAAELEEVLLVSDSFAGMRERGLMKDSFHYYQAGYNECGREAGMNAGRLAGRV